MVHALQQEWRLIHLIDPMAIFFRNGTNAYDTKQIILINYTCHTHCLREVRGARSPTTTIDATLAHHMNSGFDLRPLVRATRSSFRQSFQLKHFEHLFGPTRLTPVVDGGPEDKDRQLPYAVMRTLFYWKEKRDS